MREISTKSFNLGNGWGIRCRTITTNGVSVYEVDVVMEYVEWKEVVESVKNLSTPAEANTHFKRLVEKYKNLR